jgi:predicted DNA-binding protein
MAGKEPRRGPRGGTTTRKPGQVKKTLWLHDDEAKELRKLAYEQYRSEASIIREAIRRYLDLED